MLTTTHEQSAPQQQTPTDSTAYHGRQILTGKYTVYATFGGTQSYWPSQATSAFTVGSAEATTTTAPIQNTPQSTADQYFVPAIAGLVSSNHNRICAY